MPTASLDQLEGRLIAMSQVPLGSYLTADAPIGATDLEVAETGDFDEDGGQIATDDGAVYTYIAVDDEASTIELETGLTVALTADDPVNLYDEDLAGVIVEYVGLVLLDDQDPGDEPIEVTVQHSLVDLLAETIRGGAAEAVTLVRDGDDDFMIWQVDGKVALNVALEKVSTDLNAALTQLNSDLNVLNTVTLPQVQSDLAGAQTSIDSLSGLFPITSTSISDGAITTPKMTANSINGDRIAANTLHAGKIVALSITGDKLAANSISADKIIANSIGADRLAANAIDGKVITGATVQTAASGARAVLDPAGFRAYNSGGSLVAQISGGIGGVTANYIESFGSLLAQQAQFGGVSSPVYINSGDTGDVDASGTMRAGAFKFNGTIPTTPNATNAYITTDGWIRQSTSSAAKYKENFRPVELTADDVLDAVDLVLFDYREEVGGFKDRLGVVADRAVGTPLENFVAFEGDEVENFDYGRAAFVGLITVCREQRAQLADLEAQMRDMSVRLQALEEA